MTTTSILHLTAFLFAAILPVAATPALNAQSTTSLGTVKVPFAFEAGATHLKPGTYTISTVGDYGLMISNGSKSGVSLARWNQDTNGSGATKVIFHRYGNQYFLREVWGEGQARHLVNIESKAEATLRKAPKSLTVAGVAAPTVGEVVLIVNAR